MSHTSELSWHCETLSAEELGPELDALRAFVGCGLGCISHTERPRRNRAAFCATLDNRARPVGLHACHPFSGFGVEKAG